MQRYHTIESAQELLDLAGCTIKLAGPINEDDETGLVLDCVDKDGNDVNLLIDDEGQFHMYRSKDAKCEVCGNQDIGGTAVYCKICGKIL